MKCIVTAGPSYEALDQARRLTNFSSGRLGSELVNFLQAKGHRATLLIGQQSTWRGERHAEEVMTFTTGEDLGSKLEKLGSPEVQAVFHAAAVSDFRPGKVFRRTLSGDLEEIRSGKYSSRSGPLLLELIPTEKIISHLRGWFPNAVVVGWKYEVEGGNQEVVAKAVHQIMENQTDWCVANGPAFGTGFGLVNQDGLRFACQGPGELFEKFDQVILQPRHK